MLPSVLGLAEPTVETSELLWVRTLAASRRNPLHCAQVASRAEEGMSAATKPEDPRHGH